MRERGSNTARPTEKGVGGLPIGARPVDFRSRFADFLLAIRADSVVSIRSRPVEFGASIRSIWSAACVAIRSIRSRPVEFGASIRSIWSAACLAISARRVAIRSRFANFLLAIRADSVVSRRADNEAKTQKKPDSSIVESGCSYRKASRALNLPLVPLSNTCASARSVR